jgi:hypothetical protein
MTVFREIRHLSGRSLDPLQSQLPGRIEKRRGVASGVLATATLACHSCDAPIAPGPQPLRLGDRMWCPVCRASGPVRDFVSLAVPTRPARVVIRVSGG